MENSVLCRWLCAPRDSEPADIWGLLMTSITACRLLKKNKHDAKNTPQSSLTAGCQNVIFWFLHCLLIFGRFHKYNVYHYSVFLYESWLQMNKAWGSLPQDRICAASHHPSAALNKSSCLRRSSVELILVLGCLTHSGSRCPAFHGAWKVPVPGFAMLLCLLLVWSVSWSVTEHRSFRSPLIHACLPMKMGPWGTQGRN